MHFPTESSLGLSTRRAEPNINHSKFGGLCVVSFGLASSLSVGQTSDHHRQATVDNAAEILGVYSIESDIHTLDRYALLDAD